jgi:hypothetical protein
VAKSIMMSADIRAPLGPLKYKVFFIGTVKNKVLLIQIFLSVISDFALNIYDLNNSTC